MKKKSSSRTLILAISVILVAVGMLSLAGSYFRGIRSDSSGPVQRTQELSSRHVLFLSSYDSTFVTYADQVEGIDEVFFKEGIDYDVICMGRKKFNSSEDSGAFYDLMKTRMSQKYYDAMIVADDDALAFAETYQDELFPDTPIIFMGINDRTSAEQAEALPNVTGSFENEYLDTFIPFAESLLPDATKIVAIYDNTLTGTGYRDSFFAMEEQYPELTFSGINFSEYTLEEYEELLSTIGEDTILLHMASFYDRNNNSYTISQSAGILKTCAAVPVFRISDGGFGEGITAGLIADFTEIGSYAAQTAVDVINGADVDSFGLKDDFAPTYIADYDSMKEFGLDLSLLPKGAVILNAPVNVFTLYKRIWIPVLFIIGGLVIMLWVFRKDAADERRSERKIRKSMDDLEYASEHDDTTGLYNRKTSLKILQMENTDDIPWCAVMIDINNFRDVNESYGHASGDRILKMFGARVRHFTDGRNGFVARYGGDEFLIVLYNHTMSADDPLLGELMESLSAPLQSGIDRIRLHLSIGAANSTPHSGEKAETVVLNAMLALFEAREQGADSCLLYSGEMKERSEKLEQTKSLILNAIESNGFYMVYQPQVDLKTRKLTGFEALVRMNAPGMYPGIFIPIAEQNGWIRSIGRITTELVVKQLTLWRDEGLPLVPVSINYSSGQLGDTEYISWLTDLLAKNGLPNSAVKLEITESMFMAENESSEELFSEITQDGYKLLMDDFGTGYSSLSALSYIPIDVVKLDKSLVDSYLVDGKDLLISDLIRLIHNIGKSIIVEGVETKDQIDRLANFGADVIQGYYFSKPVMPEEAAVWLKERT